MSSSISHDTQTPPGGISQSEKGHATQKENPGTQKRVLIMTALYLAIFLTTLDQNIISTAIPRITDDFNSLDDIGWYGSAYLLTTCSFQLLMGKIYKFYPAKPIFLAGITIFELGSAVCGSASSSKTFIIGRAIAGLGTSGLFSGAMVIMFYTIPLQQRPIYQGFGGAVFAVASVVGPLLGDRVDRSANRPPLGQILRQLDITGFILFAPFAVMLLLALQWDSIKYAWNSAIIIGLFCGSAGMLLILGAWEYRVGEGAMIPFYMVRQRIIYSSCLVMGCMFGSLLCVTFYLPIYFQAVKGVTPGLSGVYLLPSILSAMTIVVVFLILQLPNQKLDSQSLDWVAKLKLLDPVAFVGIQIWKQESGTLPPRLIKQRSIAAAIWFIFFNGSSMMIILYYLPIWFQAIKNVNAVRSGIMLLPIVFSTVFASLSSGILVSKFGYYTPFFFLSSVTMAIGAGLLSTLTLASGQPQWIGYQVLFGIGVGSGIQQPMNVVQTILEKSDIATGSAVIMLMRFLGAAIFLPVAENIFLVRLISELRNLPYISTQAVIDGGATQLRQLASASDLYILLSDYNMAIVDVFYLAVVVAVLTIFGSLLVEWRSLRVRAAEQAGESTGNEESINLNESV